ncbi:MAG: thiamine pyrophosphate-binding protein [Acidobacteriia bacterium]|nr:thiamine pyrophosphate-binding protein [Terriglobia bacterium]
MLTKEELLKPLARLRADAVVVTCMGITRPWGKYSQSALDFASADSAMGHTADLALGIALACPQRKVICLNGDGSMLMTLGTLATAVQAAARNYILFVIQNGTYEITGNQPVPGAGLVDFAALGQGAGFRRIYSFDDADTYAANLPEVLTVEGPVLAVAKVKPGAEGPISRSDKESSHYLKVSLAEWGRRLRQALAMR